jgi:hypothetical protein
MMKDLKNVPATKRSTNMALTPRAQMVLGYLVHGIDEPDPEHPDIPTGKPLGRYQVAAILRVRQAYIRGLVSEPVFKVEMGHGRRSGRLATKGRGRTRRASRLAGRGQGCRC